jgi:hypothetical protein
VSNDVLTRRFAAIGARLVVGTCSSSPYRRGGVGVWDPDGNWHRGILEVFARGAVRHPDHATIVLHGWHRVAMSAEQQARSSHAIASGPD